MTRRTALLGLLCLAACRVSPRVPDLHYYTLTVPGTPPAQLGAPLEVGRFTAEAPYDTERIAFRTSPYRLDYYVYHRWAADPRQLLAASVRDYADHVTSGDGAAPYVLDVTVRRLEEVDSPDGWQGRMALDVTVRRGGETVLERSFDEVESATQRSTEAVVAALSRALGRILDAIVLELARRPAALTTASPPPGRR